METTRPPASSLLVVSTNTPASTKPQEPEAFTIHMRDAPNTHMHDLLLWVVSLWLVATNLTFLYFIATFKDRAECSTCVSNSTPIPVFVWYTSWTLWLTSLLHWHGHWQGVYRISISAKNIPTWRILLFQIVLPLSLGACLGYSAYSIKYKAGADTVDSDLCYNVGDSAIPRAAVNETRAVLFLFGDRLVNATAHYICPIWNMIVFFFYRREYCFDNEDEGDHSTSNMGTAIVFCWMTVHGAVIALVHEFVDDVYCVVDEPGGIYSIVACSLFLVVGLHTLLFRKHGLFEKCCSPSMGHSQQCEDTDSVDQSTVLGELENGAHDGATDNGEPIIFP